METPKLEFGHTFQSNNGEMLGSVQDSWLKKNDTNFIAVELKICGGHEYHEFIDLKSLLEYSKHHNLVYRYLEYTNAEQNRRVFVLHNMLFSDKVVGYQNYYGIGDNWKLYINSKEDIVVQHLQFPKTDITVRFTSFPMGKEFYVNLSCLIFALTNYKLVTEQDIRGCFQKIKDCTAN